MDEMQNHKFGNKGFILKVLALLLLAGIVVVSIIRDRIVSNQQWTVQVPGEGRIVYTPDVAKVTLGVQVDRVPNAEQAMKELNEKIAKIIKAVKDQGIADSEIQTENYNLNPITDYIDNRPVTSGYSANEQLLITIKDISDNARVGKIISAATSAGANQVSNIAFELSNMSQIKQEARIKAILDAKVKAKELSQKSGIKFGRIVGWWENTPVAMYDAKGGMGIGGGVTPETANVQSGNYEYVVEVNINYLVK
jgi:uncharacterized protein